jgi:hypothetical protein
MHVLSRCHGLQRLLRSRVPLHALGGTVPVTAWSHRVAARRGLRLDPRLSPALKNQQASLGTCLLDGRAHERIDQHFQDDLAGDGLRHL